MKIRFLVLSAATLLLAACVKDAVVDPSVSEGGLIPLNIDGKINQVATKASSNGFDDGDALGLFAVNYLSGNTVAGEFQIEGNQADNAKYVFDYSAYKWNSVKPVYYKDVNTNVDLYCYYPYQEKISSINEFNFQVLADQSSARTENELGGYESSDFIWGKATGVAPTESRISIKLNHMLAGVQVSLVKGDGFADGEFDLLAKTVVVQNTSRKASINLSTGVVSVVGGPQATGIVMDPQGDNSFRAVVVPQNVAAGEKLFSITLGTVSYGFKNSTAAEYLAGKLTSFTIRVNRKSPSGEIELVLTDSKIVDWVEDRNTHGGEAKQFYVVNLSQPGQLGRTIKADKKNPDKIRNLKVVGTVNDNDFYFMRDSMAILESVNMKESVLRCFDGKTEPRLGVGVSDMSDEDKQNLIKEEGYPDRIYYNDEGREDSYFWYPESAFGAYIPQGAFYEKASLYFFEFPEIVTEILNEAFYKSNISGELVFPDDVCIIGNSAFNGCKMLTGLTLPLKLEEIRYAAFSGCSALSGHLELPNRLRYIGDYSFHECKFTGSLNFPNSLEYIGSAAFRSIPFTGDLRIPDLVKEIKNYTFMDCGFNGTLDLNNVTEIGDAAFSSNRLQGELILPEGLTEIGGSAFAHDLFSSIVFPSTLRRIGGYAFGLMTKLTEVKLNEGLLTIEDIAFWGSSMIRSIYFPSTLLYIGEGAFKSCDEVSSIVCRASQVPNVGDGAFDGVSKDSFTLEVPENRVAEYQAAPGWGDFRKIAGHYEFSISRNLMRGLNAEISNTYVLNVPSGFDWSIQSKPDWVTVTPAKGTGKTSIKVTFSKMSRTSNLMDNADRNRGRDGEIVFLLDGKNYRTSMIVEQYDCDYSDGQSVQIRNATKGKGIDIVYIGEGYDARDIATGKFMEDYNNGNTAFFGLEPYRTYRDYFNVYAVVSLSKDSGVGTENTVLDTKFGSYKSKIMGVVTPNPQSCFSWASKAKSSIDFSKSLVIMLMNFSAYDGYSYMYGDGSALSCCPVSTNAYPYDFRGIIQHEAGGHGFGKLGDETIIFNDYISGQSEDDSNTPFGYAKSNGWYRNLTLNPDMNTVPWSHMIFHTKYSDYVDIYEGGYSYTRGVFRSEGTSCMGAYVPYYSAISRQAIVERIMDYAGEEFTFEKFVEKDSRDFGATTAAGSAMLPLEYKPDYRNHKAPIYMGEHLEF